MTFVRTWLRPELPRWWRSSAVLALLIAFASGTLIAVAASARRAANALERVQGRPRPATAAIYSNTPYFDWEKISALPEVEASVTTIATPWSAS